MCVCLRGKKVGMHAKTKPECSWEMKRGGHGWMWMAALRRLPAL